MNPPARRVFVALWPPAEVRVRLAAIGESLVVAAGQGRRIAADNLHLTLAFIGLLPDAAVPALAGHVANWQAEEFPWQIDRLGAFPRAKVLWAGGNLDVPLATLASDVRTHLDRLDIGYDRKPFAPHVTLVRNVRALPSDVVPAIAPPITWVCRRPVLVESCSSPVGPRYVPLGPV